MKKSKMGMMVVAMGLMVVPLKSATLFTDDFTGVTSATLNNAGWYSYNGNSSGQPWQVATNNNAPLSGNVLWAPSGSAGWTMTTKQFTPTTLTNVGDSITVQLDFYTAVTAQTLGVALLNVGSTITSNNFGGTSPFTTATGYLYNQSLSASATSAVYKEVDSSSSSPTISTSTATSTIGDSTVHTLIYSITKTASGIQIASSMMTSGVTTTFESFEDSSGSIYTTFDSLRLNGVGGTVYYDNISVTFSAIPEPQGILMSILGIILLTSIYSFRRGRFIQAA